MLANHAPFLLVNSQSVVMKVFRRPGNKQAGNVAGLEVESLRYT